MPTDISIPSHPLTSFNVYDTGDKRDERRGQRPDCPFLVNGGFMLKILLGDNQILYCKVDIQETKKMIYFKEPNYWAKGHTGKLENLQIDQWSHELMSQLA